MPNNSPNLYSLGALPGFDPQARRTMQDLVDQLNFLTGEVSRLRERDLVVMPQGAARKENPQQGIITIPGVTKDGFVRVNPDGVISSYSSPSGGLDSISLVTNLYTNVLQGSVISNTAAETSLFSGESPSVGSTRTIFGNSSISGTVYFVRIVGRYAATGAPTGRIRVKLNSTTIADTNTFTLGNTGDGIYSIDFDIHVNSVGNLATVTVRELRGEFVTNTAGALTPTFAYASGSTSPIDLTIDEVIDVTFQFSAANVANVIFMGLGDIVKHRY